MATYKVIGVGQKKKYFDEESYHVVINYIFSHAKYVGGNLWSAETAADEMLDVANQFRKNRGKRIRHSTLSFHRSEGINAETANNFASKIIQYYAYNYQIVYAVHDNTDEVHIHFVMNQVSYVDGYKYSGKKKDYYAFKKYMESIIRLPVRLVKNREDEDLIICKIIL